MLMLMLIWLQGGKLVWSDGSPADFSVWLEGGLNYKVFVCLLSEVGLNFLCNVFCTLCHHGLKALTPLRFPGHASLSLQPPSFKWESFRGSVIRSFRGSVIWRYWFNRLFPQETSCRTGIGEEKEDGMEDFYVCQIKIPPQGWPSHNILHDFQYTDQDMWKCFDQLSI